MKKKGWLRVVAYLLIILSGVFFYLYYNDGLYAIDSKYKNEAMRDLVVSEGEDPLNRVIDFERLKGMNSDVVGWVYMPGTTVDYPILIGDTNDTYLNMDINKEYSPLGSIFSFSDAKRDLSEGHVLLFGHNMKRQQMFGELRKFVNEEGYAKEHTKFYIYLENKVMELDIASIFITDENDEFFSVGRELGTADYVDFFTSVIGRNKYSDYTLENSRVSVVNSQIFSLVTCYGAVGTSNRLVVNGAVAREKFYINR